jgi:hypothetical protein
MAPLRFSRRIALQVWFALVAFMLVVGRRVAEFSHIDASQGIAKTRWHGVSPDILDASLLLLFSQPAAPGGGGSNPALSNFGLRRRHMAAVRPL